MTNFHLPSDWRRKAVFIRDKFKCRYCGCSTTIKDHTAPTFRTVDHLIPKSMGGRANFVNLVTACKRCNEKKSNMSVKEAGMTLRPTPVHSDDEMHEWFARVYLHRCVNCGRASKSAHTDAKTHGGARYCVANNYETLYMSRNEYEYLKSIGEIS